MRKREMILIVALLAAGVLALVGFRTYANADRELAEARALVGASRSEGIEKLGADFKSFARGAGMDLQLADIAHEYEPDPPSIAVDEILVYRRSQRIIIVYLGEGS